jgi:hypothetical protein
MIFKAMRLKEINKEVVGERSMDWILEYYSVSWLREGFCQRLNGRVRHNRSMMAWKGRSTVIQEWGCDKLCKYDRLAPVLSKWRFLMILTKAFSEKWWKQNPTVNGFKSLDTGLKGKQWRVSYKRKN